MLLNTSKYTLPNVCFHVSSCACHVPFMFRHVPIKCLLSAYCRERVGQGAKSIFVTPLTEKLTGRKKNIAKQSEKLTRIQTNLILQTVPSENGHRSNLSNKNQLIFISICHKVKHIKNMTIKTMKNKGNTAKQNADFLLFTQKNKGF